jgi:K+-sensing histidine kinase KdpD
MAKPDSGRRPEEKSGHFTSLFMHLVSQDLGEPFADFRRRFEELAEEKNLYRLRENLGELSESLYRMDRLVHDLVDTASMESGGVVLEEETVDLASILSEQISRRLRRLRGFRIQPEIPAALMVRGDAGRFATLINDLLDAVILLSPGGGTILFRLEEERGNISLSAENRTAAAPPGPRGSFLDWLRDGLHEKEGFEAIGIGLYRSHLLAQMWGGTMDLETPPEGGISFTVRLPDRK